jgi:hypothetical protein
MSNPSPLTRFFNSRSWIQSIGNTMSNPSPSKGLLIQPIAQCHSINKHKHTFDHGNPFDS